MLNFNFIYNMKLKYVVFSIIIVLTSCSESFLDLYPETSLHEENFYKSDNDFIQLVNGSYIPLRDNEKSTHWNVSEVKSDNMDLQWSNTNIEQNRNSSFDYNSASTTHKSHWDTNYKGIYNCNKAINVLENIEYQWKNVNLKERSHGEVYFLRALYYFNLVRQFGGVPLLSEAVSGDDAINIKRSTLDETYNFIIRDLEKAIGHLKNIGTTNEYGRVNLGAAQGLLGKVYLTIKNYSTAEEYLKEVIDSGKFGLLENYADVFDPTHKDYYETIFSIQYSENSEELSNSFIFFNAPATSGGAITNRPNVNLNVNIALKPTETLINAFELGDERYSVSIGEWTGKNNAGNIETFYYCAKYKGPQTAGLGWCGDNFPILRYSDILLMYAEALNELGRTADASVFVKKVRNRANLTNDISNLNQSELRLLIEHERQVEFCFENQRWYDLLRTDRAIEVNAALGKTLLPHQLIAPIPGDQIMINKLEQNPGY